MSIFTIRETNGEPNQKEKEVLVNGLLAHHQASGHIRKTEQFSVFAYDLNNQPIAGIIVSFLWNGMHIDSLWVDEKFRNKGIATKLLKIAENKAKSKNCNIAYTDTFTWQALGFYKKQGFTIYGELIDFPEGYSLTYVQKKL